ncbi:hypothetical protein BDR05DRAFT_953715 [Suillus weaverae]|nr:hypothetical protein BDR05DRAFT_953715 [Suillus weaverae]
MQRSISWKWESTIFGSRALGAYEVYDGECGREGVSVALPSSSARAVSQSTAWVEDLQGKVLHDEIKEAEMRTVSAEKKIAEEEQAMLQAESKSAEVILAKEAAEKGEEAAKKKPKDDQWAKRDANDRENTHRIAKQCADDLAKTRRAAKKRGITAESHRLAMQEKVVTRRWAEPRKRKKLGLQTVAEQ